MQEVIQMGKIGVAKPGKTLRTTLGSCVGVILFDLEKKVYGLAHVMLPEAPEPEPAEFGKYMDTAIPALIKEMGYFNSDRLKAKIAGGADMFSGIKKTSTVAIGERNIEAALKVLANLKIPIIAKEVGGTKGRQMIVDPELGKIQVTQIGSEAVDL